MAGGRFVEAGSDLGHRNWPIGPYRASSMFGRRRGKEVGTSVEFCYPKEQYDAFNTQRNEAQTRMMILAPRMAEIILALVDGGDYLDAAHELADELKAIDGGRMKWVVQEKGTAKILYVANNREDAVMWRDLNGSGFVNNIFCLDTD